MSGKIEIFLLDKSNNLIEEINIIKPKTYEILNVTLKNNLKNLPEFFTLFYPSSNNREIEIHNDEEYQLLKDTLFIRQIEKVDLGKSIFDIAYDKLDESKRDILDEKYNCFICQENIKHENPLFCYICQKIFHFVCLENWSKKRLNSNLQLICPYCKKELPLEEWKRKLDYEENRKKDAEIINQLKRDNIIKNEIFDKFKEYKIKTAKLFKEIINKNNEFNLMLNKNIHNNINKYMQDISDDNVDLELDKISQIIFKQYETLEEYIKNQKNVNKIKSNDNDKNNINIILNENNKKINSDDDNNFHLIDDNKIINFDNLQNNKNKIELIYYSKYGGFTNIFGTEFVNFNKNNIKLIINDSKNCSLIDTFYLKKGKNNIKLIIENDLTNLSYMFYNCIALQNINGLKYLNTSKVTNFSNLFWGCSSLTDINSIKYWDVSNVADFSYLFTGCSSLINLSPLENWNVKNGVDFSYMFCRCLNLINISHLRNWNVSKGKNFSYMFSGCFLLSNLSPIANWNIMNARKFEGIFSQCKSLSDFEQLNKWKKNYVFELNKIK